MSALVSASTIGPKDPLLPHGIWANLGEDPAYAASTKSLGSAVLCLVALAKSQAWIREEDAGQELRAGHLSARALDRLVQDNGGLEDLLHPLVALVEGFQGQAPLGHVVARLGQGTGVQGVDAEDEASGDVFHERLDVLVRARPRVVILPGLHRRKGFSCKSYRGLVQVYDACVGSSGH